MAKVLDSVIIGAGLAGIGAAIRLKESGIDNFIILERKNEVGGTWRDNTYPGCTCDIPSFLYSYSFEPNPDWSASFSPHNEILAYLKHCIEKYKIAPHLVFNSEVKEIKFEKKLGQWKVFSDQSSPYQSRTVISCSGPLNEAVIPKFKNNEAFKGERFHSLNWNHAFKLKNKSVAVIGTGASAIQFIPEIAKEVKSLTIFQRTAPWIEPKEDKKIEDISKKRFRKYPIYQKFWRELIYWILELRGTSQYRNNFMRSLRTQKVTKHLYDQISDQNLRQKLTPSYEIGCKRVLISNEYYPALTQPHVELVTESIASFTTNGIQTSDQKKYPVDAIIYGTGFKTTTFSHIYKITGLNNRSLFDEWNKEGAEAFKGTNVAGFPNLLFVVGPNTGLGHNSIIHMMESQFNYIVDYLKKLKEQPSVTAFFDVKEEKQKAFNDKIHEELKQMVWTTGGCNSYYLKNSTGKNTSIWPGSTMKFRKITRKISLKDYHIKSF